MLPPETEPPEVTEAVLAEAASRIVYFAGVAPAETLAVILSLEDVARHFFNIALAFMEEELVKSRYLFLKSFILEIIERYPSCFHCKV